MEDKEHKFPPHPLAELTPEQRERFIAFLRSKTPAEKLQMVDDLNNAARGMALIRIRAKYGPNLSEREERLRLAALWLKREEMIRWFDWDPVEKGY